MIVGLVGFIGSGKNTVAELYVKEGYKQDSFAAPLKDMCSVVFGWPRHLLEGDTVESREFRETPDMFWTRKTGIPNFTPRLALQMIGTDVMRDHFHQDIWLNSLEYRLMSNPKQKDVVISDCRFRNELEIIHSLGGKVIWVQRGDLPEWYDTAVKAMDGSVIDRKIMQTRYGDVHESEWNWAGFEVDYIIDNNGTLAELEQNVFTADKQTKTPRFEVI